MNEQNVIQNVGFSVDAGLIQRLGYELVGRAETAVSELIKNAYDADATYVRVQFNNSNEIGGSLTITDDGIGMTLQQLTDGFMRISSSEKVHNPTSLKFQRQRAGKKGIGRFAAQRLGKSLTIVTQTIKDDFAYSLTIDWEEYTLDKDLTTVTFPIIQVAKEREEGTSLYINGLSEKWSESGISRINRYVMDLFQPDYLSDRSRREGIAIRNEATFKVEFYNNNNNNIRLICNEQVSLFDKALAIFEGNVDKFGNGIVYVNSNSLDLNDTINVGSFPMVSDVHFKVHYYIYNRPEYYKTGISQVELKRIQDLSKNAAGVRLYRNGFRVLPYGEPSDDWTNIDKRWSAISGKTNVPMANKNLFGFVEIIDSQGDTYEETSSREGLIENEAFHQLSDYIYKCLEQSRLRVAEKIKALKNNYDPEDYTHNSEEKEQTTQDILNRLDEIVSSGSSSAEEGKKLIGRIHNLIEEAGMLRVLAGLGLTIGEFTHEIKQFQPSVYGNILQLKEIKLPFPAMEYVDNIQSDFDRLFEYTQYFSATISQNTNRGKEPIDILQIFDLFRTKFNNDFTQNNIQFEVYALAFDAITIPMHKSEWSSIIFNLYTNSRKAIKRQNVLGKILVTVDSDINNSIVRFQDNGDGIPDENKFRIFNAFFSTSVPASYDAPENDQLVGTGLGLKIVKDIIISYKGNIILDNPDNGFSTCFKIVLPLNK